MEIKSLHYFTCVAKHLNFTKAAKECSITQTAMSLHISKLESELSLTLFIRNNRNVALTPAGRIFLEQARKILMDYQEAVYLAHNASLGYENYLTIGTSNYADAFHIIDSTRKFHERYRNVKIENAMSHAIHLPDGFRASGVDVGVCVPYEFMRDDDFAVIPFLRRPLRFVLGTDHPLAKLNAIDPRSIANETLYVLAVSHLRRTTGLLNLEWQMSGIDPKRLVEVDNFDTILFLVTVGLGLGLVPCYQFDDKTGRFKFADFKGEAPYADLALVYSKSNQNPALKLFLEIFLKKHKPIRLPDARGNMTDRKKAASFFTR
jgi:DNA-binding transcriptional LysR family regulator